MKGPALLSQQSVHFFHREPQGGRIVIAACSAHGTLENHPRQEMGRGLPDVQGAEVVGHPLIGAQPLPQ